MSERNIVATLQCFVKKGNKYLMLHRNANKRILPNVWMGPGGKREFNEGLFESAQREVMEETGLKIKNLRIMCTGWGYLKDIDQEVFFHFIEADYDSGEVIQNPEDGELCWLTLPEILKLDNLLAELKEVLPITLKPNAPMISYRVFYEKGNEMTEFKIESSI